MSSDAGTEILPCAQKLQRSYKFFLTRQFLIYSADHTSDCVFTSSNPPAWKRLASPTLSMNERAALITSVFSDRDEAGLLKYLSGDDAQVFVDAIDEASIHI